jgi:hypothetical protein
MDNFSEKRTCFLRTYKLASFLILIVRFVIL